MRKINTEDVFRAARLLKALDIRDELRRFASAGAELKDAPGAGKEEAIQELGMDVLLTVLTAASDAGIEAGVYALLAGITEKTPEMIKCQSLDVTVSDIRQIAAANDIAVFFKRAGRLTPG